MAAAGRLPVITRPSVRPGPDDRLWARVARTRRLPVSYDYYIMRVVPIIYTLVSDLCSIDVWPRRCSAGFILRLS